MSFFSVSYSPNYFSLEDILATQERVPCTFLVDVPEMGKLNPSACEKYLASGTNLELPLWLVKELWTGRRPVVNADLPKIFKEAHREILKADACTVDLHKFNLYFYEFGAHVKAVDRKGDVHKILLHTFVNRFKQIMEISDNLDLNSWVQQKISTLDTLEKKLFDSAYAATVKLNSWLIKSGVAIQAADLVVNHKKRKRCDLDDILD